MKKILIMAGGTGGHVFPGIAVAKELSKNDEFEVTWLGTAEKMEAQLVPANGFKIEFIKVKGLRRNGIIRKLVAPLMILRAIFMAYRVVKKVKPDVVLGMGGYASGPGGVAAKLAGIPLVLHEQNAKAGLTNRLLSKIADKILLGFPGAFSGDNVQYVGNPVRANVIALRDELPKSFEGETLKICVVGGSLGAQMLNTIVPEAIAIARKNGANIKIIHQTGKGNSEQVKSQYQKLGIEDAEVSDFIDDMASLYKNNHLIICRAGALTVAEITVAAIPAIFVPLPTAVDDHQTKNAQVLVDNNAAIIMPQKDLTAQSLAEKICEYSKDRAILSAMSQNCAQMAKLSATTEAADVCRELALKK